MDCPWIDSGYRGNNRAIRAAFSNSGDVTVFMQSIRDCAIQALLSNLYKEYAIDQGSMVKVVKLG